MGIRGSGTRCRVDVSILTTGYGAQCRSCISLTEIGALRPPEDVWGQSRRDEAGDKLTRRRP